MSANSKISNIPMTMKGPFKKLILPSPRVLTTKAASLSYLQIHQIIYLKLWILTMNHPDKLLLIYKSKMQTRTAIFSLLAVTGKLQLKLKERIKSLLTEMLMHPTKDLNSKNNAKGKQNFKESKTFYLSLLKDQPNHLKKHFASMLIPS